MSAPIGPGDWVEYVGDYDEAFVVGRLYCVRRIVSTGISVVCACHGKEQAFGLDVHEVQLPPNDEYHESAWCPDGFRPIYRPKADLIEQLKQPAPDIERVTEDA